MNWLDYVLIAILAFSTLQSFRRGFSREIISLSATVIGFVLGMWFYGSAGLLVSRWISSPRIANLAGFLLVFVAVVLVGAIVGAIVRKFLSAVGLSFFDRLLGALFGLLRGALIAVALLTAWIAFAPRGDSKSAPGAMVHSQIAPYLMKASSLFVSIAPAELRNSFREVYDEALAEIKNIAQRGDGARIQDSGKK
ncbi:MAG TPA: CvpA family protein [Bryobacteraceae bacterium]|nr:CvpA family protein [Bryobacteraceae bacterium]